MANNENHNTEEQAVKKWKVRDKHGHVKKSGSLAVVGSVNVEVDSTGGDHPTADSTYQNGQLGITFHDIKGERGNGITSIEVEENQEDGGDNIVHIHCTDDEEVEGTTLRVKNGKSGNGITDIQTTERTGDGEINDVTIKTREKPEGDTFHVRNGHRGNGIVSVTEDLSPTDGGINTHTITDTDGHTHAFHSRNGRQGDSVLVGQGDLPLAHVLGNDNTKAMSQGGVNAALNEGKISNGETTETQDVAVHAEGGDSGFVIDFETGEFVGNASAHRAIELELTQDMKSITYNASKYTGVYKGGYVFLKSDGTRISGERTTTNDNITIDVTTPLSRGATKFRCCRNVQDSTISVTIKKKTFSWAKRYNTISNATDGYATPKAVDNALKGGKVSNETTVVANQQYYTDGSSQGFYVNPTTGEFVAIDSYRSIELELSENIKSITYVASRSTVSGYAFIKDNGSRVSGDKTTEPGKITIDASGPIASGATKFRCSINAVTGSYIPLTIVYESFSWAKIYNELGGNKDGWMTQRAVTKAIKSVESWEWENVESELESVTAINQESTYGWAVNGETGELMKIASFRTIEVPLTEDMISIRFAATANTSPQYPSGYAFLDTNGQRVSGERTTVAYEIELDIQAALAEGATKLRCCRNQTESNTIDIVVKTGDKVKHKNKDGKINIFFIGNSHLQDGIACLPALLREIAPNLDFTICNWYLGSGTMAQILGQFENGTAAQYFSVCENDSRWANYHNIMTISDVLARYNDFDIVVLGERMTQEDEIHTDGVSEMIFWLREHLSKAFHVASAIYSPVRYGDMVAHYNKLVANSKAIYKETDVESIINAGGATMEAMKTELDNLGDLGHLSPDTSHSQDGLPCLLMSYVYALWMFRLKGLPYGITGSKLRITQEVYDYINVPGPNLGDGVITGTDEQHYIAQLCAIKADKAAQAYERQAQDEMLTS